MRRRVIAAIFLGLAILCLPSCLIVGIIANIVSEIPYRDPIWGQVQLGMFIAYVVFIMIAYALVRPKTKEPPT